MPFGIQGITACGVSYQYFSDVLNGSPMPFGIQGITAMVSLDREIYQTIASPMPFGIQGITALRS